MKTPNAAEPREYEPPMGDEQLDLIEQALVRMWIEIIGREIEQELALERDGSDDVSAEGARRA